MSDSNLISFAFQIANGATTILEKEYPPDCISGNQLLSAFTQSIPSQTAKSKTWLREPIIILASILQRLLPPFSQTLLERLQQGIIGIKELEDRGGKRETEIVVAELLRRYGFKNRLTRRSKDGGIDICAVRSVPYVESGYVRSIWEVKNYQKPVPVNEVRQLGTTLLRCRGKVDWMVLIALPRLTRKGPENALTVFTQVREESWEALKIDLELIEEEMLNKYINLSPDSLPYQESESDREALRELILNVPPPGVPLSQKIYDHFRDLPL